MAFMISDSPPSLVIVYSYLIFPFVFHITLGSPYVLVWPNVAELRVLRVLTYSLYRPVIAQ